VSRTGNPPHISTAQRSAGRTGEPPEYAHTSGGSPAQSAETWIRRYRHDFQIRTQAEKYLSRETVIKRDRLIGFSRGDRVGESVFAAVRAAGRRPALAVAIVVLLVCAACGASTDDRFGVRVLVITMFSAETAPWLGHEQLSKNIAVPGVAEPIRCTNEGLCVATVGEGKANAAASMSSILDNPALDLSHAYFITAGIGGTSPKAGTIGFGGWARYLVDWDLGHHLDPATIPDVPFGYLPRDSIGTNVFRLNDALVDQAYSLTKGLELADSPQAVETRSHYPGQAGRTPFVDVCDTITGDDFWNGVALSQEAEHITSIWTKGQGSYCTTQMEDNATATVLDRHGYLNRYLTLRTASNFDQPYPGQSARAVLAGFPGGTIAAENAYTLGSVVAHYLVDHQPAQ
jgi:purine nucleoside permease